MRWTVENRKRGCKKTRSVYVTRFQSTSTVSFSPLLLGEFRILELLKKGGRKVREEG